MGGYSPERREKNITILPTRLSRNSCVSMDGEMSTKACNRDKRRSTLGRVPFGNGSIHILTASNNRLSNKNSSMCCWFIVDKTAGKSSNFRKAGFPFNTEGMFRGWIGEDGVPHIAIYAGDPLLLPGASAP